MEGTNVEERVFWLGRGRGGEDTNVEERMCVCVCVCVCVCLWHGGKRCAGIVMCILLLL